MSMINTCLHKICFMDESETEKSPLPNSYNGKKVSNTFPSKMFIEESPLVQRKFSLEPFNFYAPQIKPLEIRLTPSKLRLNTKGFKDLKINQENQILLECNNYYISCPENETSESDTDQYIDLRGKKNPIKLLRKNMTIEKKNNLPKVLSKEIVNKNSLNYEEMSDLYDIVDNDESQLQPYSILRILESNIEQL